MIVEVQGQRNLRLRQDARHATRHYSQRLFAPNPATARRVTARQLSSPVKKMMDHSLLTMMSGADHDIPGARPKTLRSASHLAAALLAQSIERSLIKADGVPIKLQTDLSAELLGLRFVEVS